MFLQKIYISRLYVIWFLVSIATLEINQCWFLKQQSNWEANIKN